MSMMPINTSTAPIALIMLIPVTGAPKRPKLSMRSPAIIWPKHKRVMLRALPITGMQIIPSITIMTPQRPPHSIHAG